MLDSLRVTNFRAFRDLHIHRLGKVNLIVGRNNVGKTSLLEAVHLYSSGDILDSIIRLLRCRQEYSLEKGGRIVLYDNLFYQDAKTTARIEIGQTSGENQLVIRPMWSWTEEIEMDAGRQLQRQFSENPPEDAIIDATEVLTAKRGAETMQSVAIKANRYPPSGKFRESSNSLLLPASGFQDDSVDTAELWGRVVLTDKESSVLDALRVIEPDLERIAMVHRKGAEGITIVKLAQKKNRPLRSLGDGMNKLFELALGLVNVGEFGVFLVDEIDSGLHFATLVDVWRLVFRTAASLQVQVFATTHSWDCIEAFQEAANEHPDDGLLIRLERNGKDIEAELFSEQDLTIITRESIEVR